MDYLDDHFQVIVHRVTCAELTISMQLVAQKLKVKSMESRIEMEAQYDEDNRDGRTLRQKVLALIIACTLYVHVHEISMLTPIERSRKQI